MSETKLNPAGCFVILASIPVGTILNYFALRQMYEWFIVPIFPNAPHLTLFQIGGIASIFYFLSGHLAPKQDDNERKTTAEIVTAVLTKIILGPVIALVLGYITYRFIQAGY